jgi:hypothetical protein
MNGTDRLRDALADYLVLRRALGYRLVRPETLLNQFLDYLEDADASVVTVDADLREGRVHRLRVEQVRDLCTGQLSRESSTPSYLHKSDSSGYNGQTIESVT